VTGLAGLLTAVVSIVAVVVLLAPLAVLTPALMIGGGLVIGGIFGVAALHYLVWGWWLGSMIKQEEDEDDEGHTA
jgi:hypothetical protein